MDNTQTIEEAKDGSPTILIDKDQQFSQVVGDPNENSAHTHGLPTGQRPSLLQGVPFLEGLAGIKSPQNKESRKSIVDQISSDFMAITDNIKNLSDHFQISTPSAQTLNLKEQLLQNVTVFDHKIQLDGLSPDGHIEASELDNEQKKLSIFGLDSILASIQKQGDENYKRSSLTAGVVPCISDKNINQTENFQQILNKTAANNKQDDGLGCMTDARELLVLTIGKATAVPLSAKKSIPDALIAEESNDKEFSRSSSEYSIVTESDLQRQSPQNFLFKTDDKGQHAGDPLIEEAVADPVSVNKVVTESKKAVTSNDILDTLQSCLDPQNEMEEDKAYSSGIENNTPPALQPPPIKLTMLQLIQKMTKPLQTTEAPIQISNLDENSIEQKSQVIVSTPTSSNQNQELTNISSQNRFKKSNQTKSQKKNSNKSAACSPNVLKRGQLFYEKDNLNLQTIKTILTQDKSQRTETDQKLLIHYLKMLKVFQELLGGDMEAFSNLVSAVELTDFENGQDIIVEGQDGETFYFILQGEVEVLKAQMIPISESKLLIPATEEFSKFQKLQMQETKMQEYQQAFMKHFQAIHWDAMDIQKEEVIHLLGMQPDQRTYYPYKDATPMTALRKFDLWRYIEKHEYSENFVNYQGQICMLVNKNLVYLERGAGFGELALLSGDSKRMSTCRANTKCSLGTLSRRNFSTILRKAQKKRINQQIEMLKQFKLFSQMTSLKLQKVFYLLKEQKYIKGQTVFAQGEKVSGCYLIASGKVLYKRKMQMPVIQTQNKDNQWVGTSLVSNNKFKQRIEDRIIAVFSEGEIVGIEEMLRTQCINLMRSERRQAIQGGKIRDLNSKYDHYDLSDDSANLNYNFSGIVESQTAKIYFLSKFDFDAYFRYLSPEVSKQEIEKRMGLLRKQVETITNIYSEYVESNNEKLKSIKEKVIDKQEDQKYTSKQFERITKERQKQLDSQKSYASINTFNKSRGMQVNRLGSEKGEQLINSISDTESYMNTANYQSQKVNTQSSCSPWQEYNNSHQTIDSQIITIRDQNQVKKSPLNQNAQNQTKQNQQPFLSITKGPPNNNSLNQVRLSSRRGEQSRVSGLQQQRKNTEIQNNYQLATSVSGGSSAGSGSNERRTLESGNTSRRRILQSQGKQIQSLRGSINAARSQHQKIRITDHDQLQHPRQSQPIIKNNENYGYLTQTNSQHKKLSDVQLTSSLGGDECVAYGSFFGLMRNNKPNKNSQISLTHSKAQHLKSISGSCELMARAAKPNSAAVSTMRSFEDVSQDLRVDDDRQSKIVWAKPATSKSSYKMTRAEIGRRAALNRQQDLTKSFGQISIQSADQRMQKDARPARVDLSKVTYEEMKSMKSVEDLVQKNFLKYNRRTAPAEASAADANSAVKACYNDSQSCAVTQHVSHMSKSMTNFSRMTQFDQMQLMALRRAEFNTLNRRDQALTQDSKKRSAHGSIDQDKQTQQKSVSPDLRNVSQANVQNQNQMNDRLMDVYDQITTKDLRFSQKNYGKNMQRTYDRADNILARQANKKQTLYNQVKQLDFIKSQVGPAYESIVKKRRKIEKSGQKVTVSQTKSVQPNQQDRVGGSIQQKSEQKLIIYVQKKKKHPQETLESYRNSQDSLLIKTIPPSQQPPSRQPSASHFNRNLMLGGRSLKNRTNRDDLIHVMKPQDENSQPKQVQVYHVDAQLNTDKIASNSSLPNYQNIMYQNEQTLPDKDVSYSHSNFTPSEVNLSEQKNDSQMRQKPTYKSMKSSQFKRAAEAMEASSAMLDQARTNVSRFQSRKSQRNQLMPAPTASRSIPIDNQIQLDQPEFNYAESNVLQGQGNTEVTQKSTTSDADSMALIDQRQQNIIKQLNSTNFASETAVRPNNEITVNSMALDQDEVQAARRANSKGKNLNVVLKFTQDNFDVSVSGSNSGKYHREGVASPTSRVIYSKQSTRKDD